MERKGFTSSGNAVKGREIGRLVVAVSLATSLLCVGVTGLAAAQDRGKGGRRDVPSYDPRFYTYDAQNRTLTPIPGATTDPKGTRPWPGTGLKATDDWSGTGPKAGYQERVNAAELRDTVIAGGGGPRPVAGGRPQTPEERAAADKMLAQDAIAVHEDNIRRAEASRQTFAWFSGDRASGIIENEKRYINILRTQGYDAYLAARRGEDAAVRNWFLHGFVDVGTHIGGHVPRR